MAPSVNVEESCHRGSPEGRATGIRFVPERSVSTPKITFGLNLGFYRTFNGIISLVEIVSGFICFMLLVCDRVYVYHLSHLLVRVVPDAVVLYLLLVSFTSWFVTALVFAGAVLSLEGSFVSSSLFFILFNGIGSLMYLIGGTLLASEDHLEPIGIAKACIVDLLDAYLIYGTQNDDSDL